MKWRIGKELAFWKTDHKLLGRDLENLIIFDATGDIWQWYPENTIFIDPWQASALYGDWKNDMTLWNIMHFIDCNIYNHLN